ncbi:BON domain-containing protein [bacterium BD-1]|uniref:BON domain-containing protein n=1 Tax=Arenimonas sp. TaxID=1872635 RepID=UPI001E296D7F|nr:BON domain-containing protein [Ottowia caeni]
MNALKASLLATAIALGFGAATAQAEDAPRTAGQAIDDATITASVKAKLLADDRTKGFDVNVDTRNGIVTLKGGADSQAAKLAAGQLAGQAEGVVLVKNELIVATPDTEARQDANTATLSGEVREKMDEAGDGIDDAWITSKVKTQLLADDQVKGTQINVDTKGNVVTLTGTAPSAEARAKAIELAKATRGVRGVVAAQLRVARE